MGKEDLQKKLNVESLEFQNRKELMSKFKGVGGQVIEIDDETTPKEFRQFEKMLKDPKEKERLRELEKRYAHQSRRETEDSSESEALTGEEGEQSQRQKTDQSSKKKSATQKPQQQSESRNYKEMKERRKNAEAEFRKELQRRQKEKARAEYMERKKSSDRWLKGVASKWACVFGGIFKLFGNQFKPGFMKDTHFKLKDALLDYKSVLASVLHTNKKLSYVIMDALEKTRRDFFYEIVYRFDIIYSEELFRKLADVELARKQIKAGQEPFKKLYRAMRLVSQQRMMMKSAISVILKMEQRARKLKDNVVNANIKKATDAVSVVLEDYFPKLQLLIDYYFHSKQVDKQKVDYATFLGLDETDKLGYYTDIWKKEREQEETRQKNVGREKKEQAPENDVANYSDNPIENIVDGKGIEGATRDGLRMIYHHINFAKLHAFFQSNKDARSLFEIRDKIFLLYAILDFYQKEFSFIYTSDVMNYNIIQDRLGRKLDIKKTLREESQRFDDIYRRFKEYLKILLEIRKMKSRGNQESSKEMQHLRHQQNNMSKTIIYEMRKILPEMIKLYHSLIEDYEGDKKVLLNGDEVIEKNSKVTKDKLCYKKPVIEAIKRVHQFLSAFYYLMTDGDLLPNELYLKKPIFISMVGDSKEKSPE